jgi:hypothetical protein
MGSFSQGRLNQDDQGDLMLAVTPDRRKGLVRIDFGTGLTWLALDPQTARKMAEGLTRAADAVATVDTSPRGSNS